MDNTIETGELLELIDRLENRINVYWNFYTLVVLAVAGWLFTMEKDLTVSEAKVLTVGLGVFFIANLIIMSAAIRLVVAAGEELRARAHTMRFESAALRRTLSANLLPGRVIGSVVLHVIVDVAMLITISLHAAA